MKKILIILISIIFGTVLLGQVSYNQEFQVNTYTGSWQRYPCGSSLSNNNFVVCWRSWGQGGGQEGIYAQLYDESYNKIGNEFRINALNDTWQSRICVSKLSDNKFIVSWGSTIVDGSGFGIYGKLFDGDGTAVSNEFQVNTYINNNQRLPSVSLLNNNDFVICWQSNEQDGSGLGIYAQIYDKDGIKRGGEFRVNTITDFHQSNPHISRLINGGFVICWQSVVGDGQTSIFAQIYNENGTRIGEQFQVNTSTGHKGWPKVSYLANGGFIVCWEGVYAQLFDEIGTKVGNEFRINSYTVGGQKSPSISPLSSGGFIVCWSKQDGSDYGIYAQLFDENAVKIGSEFRMNTYTMFDQTSPFITSTPNDDLLVLWESFEQDGSDYGIFGKRYKGIPIDHNLIDPKQLEPELDASLNYNTPIFKWNKATEIHLNFPWELTYDLYIDNSVDFDSPLIISGLKDTTCQIDSLTSNQTYFWKVLARNFYGDSLWSSDVFGFYIEPTITDLKDFDTKLPETFALSQNYPNPFNPTTKIKFTIPVADALNASATLKIYDILGNEITTILDEQKQPGTYEVEFDGTGLVSGIYFYKLDVGKYSETKKMLLMK